eukprot:SAG22_NODE_13270_length_412_cov_0.798722_2_plen_60_part_01
MADSVRWASEAAAGLEVAIAARCAEAEAKAKAADEVILDGWRRFSSQLQGQMQGLDRKLE